MKHEIKCRECGVAFERAVHNKAFCNNACRKAWECKTAMTDPVMRARMAWINARRRCTNPNVENYDRYGGRGIYLCHRWATFENFLADMGPRPPGTTLDRIDNDGPYSPENCRWATVAIQCRNRDHNRNSRTGFKGVRIHHTGRWAAQIKVDGKSRTIGVYSTDVEAARAYNAAATAAWGADAHLNNV